VGISTEIRNEYLPNTIPQTYLDAGRLGKMTNRRPRKSVKKLVKVEMVKFSIFVRHFRDVLSSDRTSKQILNLGTK
jgi:hypothetical protein